MKTLRELIHKFLNIFRRTQPAPTLPQIEAPVQDLELMSGIAPWHRETTASIYHSTLLACLPLAMELLRGNESVHAYTLVKKADEIAYFVLRKSSNVLIAHYTGEPEQAMDPWRPGENPFDNGGGVLHDEVRSSDGSNMSDGEATYERENPL